MNLLDQIALDTPAVFNPQEFSVPLVWNGTLTVQCIFDDPGIPVETGNGAAVSSREPQATIHLPELPDVAVGDTVTIYGEDFTVRDIMALGTDTGDAILDLSI